MLGSHQNSQVAITFQADGTYSVQGQGWNTTHDFTFTRFARANSLVATGGGVAQAGDEALAYYPEETYTIGLQGSYEPNSAGPQPEYLGVQDGTN